MNDLLALILQAGTPLVYAAMAGVLAQRAGIRHLGLEGLMATGACGSVMVANVSGSLVAGLVAAAVLCVLGSVLLWLVIEVLKANPIIAGLGLTGLGLGGTDLAVQAVFSSETAVRAEIGLPRLGQAFGPYGQLSVLVAATPMVVFLLWVLLRRTRFGLQLAACGEHPFAARSVGISPSRMRLAALALGGTLCALAGAELALGSVQLFSVDMTAGRGFMAFAAAIFGASNPVGAAFAALFFSAVEALGIKVQLMF
ncbi:MAG TPA: hypothetical protein VGC80_09550, partial [Acetobacteraceae bacterium]